ncbi:hypothetical protein M8J75_011147 [Diaphorina citri]|nr:hypothetical protein M8J75_011147 [Diaphorina citri]KAI5755402.1 hypothetical protein M8J77_016481 [Diaphorina citri]
MTSPCGEDVVPVVEEQNISETSDSNADSIYERIQVSKSLSKSQSADNNDSFLSDVFKTMSRSSSTTEERWPHLIVTQRFKEYEQSLNKLDGEWLCLKQLDDVEVRVRDPPELRSPSPEPPLFVARNPVIIERRNLVNISKLIVKELIETSQKHGRMLDSDHMPLQHFFIVLEHVLRHGLKPKKGLLGPKKELWDILQLVEKLNPEASDITASVRDLPTVK